MPKRGKSSGIRNQDRKCGKAWKKRPRKPRKTGRTINGYKPEKIKYRELKRQNPEQIDKEIVDE